MACTSDAVWLQTEGDKAEYESFRLDRTHRFRSSGRAEDLPEAGFAGQQESFLNISGEDELLEACKKCYASLFTDRAISYREDKGFDHLKIALSLGVQKMMRSDKASAGVMFTLDPETGFRKGENNGDVYAFLKGL